MESDGFVCVNLVKAQKYLEKLKRSVKTPKAKNSWSVSTTVPSCIDPANYIVNVNTFHTSYESNGDALDAREHITSLVSQKMIEFQDRLNVLEDIRRLKNCIYDKNATVGISEILGSIETLNEEKKVYASFKERFGKSDVVSPTQFVNVYKKYVAVPNSDTVNPYSNVNVFLFSDLTEIDSHISSLNAQITKKEDERDKLNMTTEIKYEFYQASRKILGI